MGPEALEIGSEILEEPREKQGSHKHHHSMQILELSRKLGEISFKTPPCRVSEQDTDMLVVTTEGRQYLIELVACSSSDNGLGRAAQEYNEF